MPFPGVIQKPIHSPKTLRDEFAMAALIGMLNSKALAHLRHAEQAETAYAFADAMLAARKKES
jgi:hypothetical protein